MTREHDSGITRRHLLRQAGAAGVAAAVGGALDLGRLAAEADAAVDHPALRLTPEQEEGPFYVALEKIRRDVRLGRPGVPLHLRLHVVDTAGKPLRNAALDVWHADAVGTYSDESSQDTVGQTWLRGVQLTSTDGVGEFTTIYPGHYQGRTTHVHVKVHVGGRTAAGAYRGGHVSHTGQLFFPDAVSTEVYRLVPYTSNRVPRTYNGEDGVYTRENGSRVVLKLRKLGAGVPGGFLGAITLVVDPAATPAAVGR